MSRAWCGILVVVAAAAFRTAADEPKAAEVVVTDVDGKETRLTAARLTTGTRRLGWLADPKGATPDEKLGPLAVEVREPNSTTLVQGVVTLVPAASVESARYDYERDTVTLAVKGLKDPLQLGVYQTANRLGVAGTADGKAAAFVGGVAGKTAVKSIVFPDARPLPAAKAGGLSWAVQIVQPKANNPTLKAKNLKPLYQFKDGTQHLADALAVRKGPPLAFDEKLTRFEAVANDLTTGVAVAEVDAGGAEKLLVILPTLEKDGKAGTLLGLVGEVELGYKLFPLHTIKLVVPLSKKAD